MISGVQVIVDTDILEAIADTAQRSPKLMQTAYERATRRLRRRLLDTLMNEPDSPDQPLKWKSEKQRRYVMRKLTLENNLPYRRTHSLSRAWRVVLTPGQGGAIMEAYNDAPQARFVQGVDQQPFLVKWPYAPKVIEDYRVEANEVLIQVWFTVSDPYAGV